MTRDSDPYRRSHLRVMEVNQQYPGRVATGDDAVFEAMIVSAGAVQELASRKAWFWPMFAAQPQASMVAIATGYELTISGGATRAEFPWLVQPGFDQIMITGTVAVQRVPGVTVAIRWSSDTLITAVTGATTPYVPISVLEARAVHSEHASSYEGRDLLVGSFSVVLEPEIPADRLILLYAEARYDAPNDTGASISVPLGLQSLMVSDHISSVEDT